MVKKLEALAANGQPGQSLIYHRGFLWTDRDGNPDLNSIGVTALNLAEAGKKEEALAMYRNELLPIHAKVKAAADTLFAFNRQKGEERGKRIMTICTITQIMLAVTSVGIFVLGFFIGFFK